LREPGPALHVCRLQGRWARSFRHKILALIPRGTTVWRQGLLVGETRRIRWPSEETIGSIAGTRVRIRVEGRRRVEEASAAGGRALKGTGHLGIQFYSVRGDRYQFDASPMLLDACHYDGGKLQRGLRPLPPVDTRLGRV